MKKIIIIASVAAFAIFGLTACCSKSECQKECPKVAQTCPKADCAKADCAKKAECPKADCAKKEAEKTCCAKEGFCAAAGKCCGKPSCPAEKK